MNQQSNSVLIVSVNYKTPILVNQLINSLSSQIDSLNAYMVVVDNDSGDDSVNIIKTEIESNKYDWVTVISNDCNGGFSSGNNKGIRYALQNDISFDFVWLLNPDTKVYDSSGDILKQFMISNNVHITGSRLEDQDGTWQCSHFRFPNWINEFCSGLKLGLLDKLLSKNITAQPETRTPIKADWLAGASLMFSCKYLDIVGLMGEGYFLYFEEVDFCLQGRRKGMPC